MKLNPRALALTSGIFCGGLVLLGTWWIVIFQTGGDTMKKLQNFYFGYSVSYLGGLIGLFWGFIQGLILGYLFAALYNLFARENSKPV